MPVSVDLPPDVPVHPPVLLAPTDDGFVGSSEPGVRAGMDRRCDQTGRRDGGKHTINGFEWRGDLDSNLHGDTVLRSVSEDQDVMASLSHLTSAHRNVDAVQKGNELGAEIHPCPPVTYDGNVTTLYGLDDYFVPHPGCVPS